MFVDQDPAGLDDVFGLAVEQADGLDVVLEAVDPQRQDGIRGVGHRKELGGGLIDPHIGRLR